MKALMNVGQLATEQRGRSRKAPKADLDYGGVLVELFGMVPGNLYCL